MTWPMNLARDDLDAYRRFVAAAAATHKVIVNRDDEHAAILIAQIFRVSRHRIDILAGSLDPKVYGSPEVMNSGHEFMSHPNAAIRILAEQQIDHGHPFVKMLSDFG